MKQILLAVTAATMLYACKKDNGGGDQPPPPPPPPVIKLDYMEVQEHASGAHLYLYGSFGDSSSTSKVRINNTVFSGDVTGNFGHIIKWQSNMIQVNIPEANHAAGHGQVAVLNKGGESQKRLLNVWEGDINYSRPDQGSLKTDIKFRVVLRADAGAHPDIAWLQTPQSSFASTSKAHYGLGGQGTSTYSDGGCLVNMTANWNTASGSIPIRIPYKNTAGVPEYYQVKMKFRNRKFEITGLDIWKNKVTTSTMTTVACGPASVVPGERILSSVHNSLKDFNLEFESATSNVIKAGSKTATGSTESGLIWNAGAVPQFDCKISWEKIVPKY